MNKPLSTVEFESFVNIPVRMIMTRREKLMRFASLVRQCTYRLVVFNSLEYYSDDQHKQIYHPQSAFDLAAKDEQLQAAGLAPDIGGSVSVHAAGKFFELSKADLHEFSCDCGGVIRNEDMARRIEGIAAR